MKRILRRVGEGHPSRQLLWDALSHRWKVGAGALLLLTISRTSGLVAPWSSKYLIDEVALKHRAELLPWLVAAVAGAMVLQAAAGYAMTLLVSKEGQRLVAELRVRVQ